MGAGAGPPRNREAHKGLLAWGACLPAPLPRTVSPGSCPGKAPGHDPGPGHWPLHLPSPPPQPEGSLVSGPALGRRQRASRTRGRRWQEIRDPFPVGTSTGPTWSPQEWGAGGGQRRPGPPSRVHPRLAPPRPPVFISLPWPSHFSVAGLGTGPVLNKHKPRWSRAPCSSLRPSWPLDAPLLPPRSRLWAGYTVN